MTPIEDFRDAMRRAAGVLSKPGKGGASVSRDQTTAMVEMMVHNVRDGELRPPLFLQHPAHLPEGEELARLVSSVAERDRQLRADATEWRDINRREAERAAVSLRNAVEAIRMADHLMNEYPDEDADAELHGWRREIEAYLRATFAVDPERAPHDDVELRAWCLESCMRANPVPLWLRTYRPGAFVPSSKPRTVAEEFVHHMNGSTDRED